MCPYHGLQFDTSGACVLNPNGPGQIPPNAKLRAYTVAETCGIVWYWPGDPTLADRSLIIEAQFLESADYKNLHGYMLVRGNYQLVVDNMLTPETGTTTHYFYTSGRKVRINDTKYDEYALALAKFAFEGQDEPMIAACQSLMKDETDLFKLRPVILQTDVAAVQARRILAKLIDKRDPLKGQIAA